METTRLRQELSQLLKKYGIDNLALEMELSDVVRLWLTGSLPARTAETTKKEIAAAIIDGASSSDIRQFIHATIISDLYLNPGGKDGVEFMEFAYIRATVGEDISTFVKWWISNYPDSKFWSFARMKTMWPQAFKDRLKSVLHNTEPDKWEQDFIPFPDKETK